MLAELREEKLASRHLRIRKKVSGTPDRPRLSVHRSHMNLLVQMIDDLAERTLYSASTRDPGFRKKDKDCGGSVQGAKKFGTYLAEELKKRKISRIVFDRGGFPYHGRIQALAESLREGGIQF